MKRSREMKVARVSLQRKPGHYIDFENGFDRLDAACPEGIFAFYPYTKTMEANTTRYASAETMAMRDMQEKKLYQDSIATDVFMGNEMDMNISNKTSNVIPAMNGIPVDKKPDNDYLGSIDNQFKWEEK